MRHPPRLAALLAGAVLALTGAVSASAGVGPGATAEVGCSVAYSTVNQWDGGFQASVVVTNNAAPTSGWSLGFAFTGGQHLTQGWGASWTQSGAKVAATNESWNGSLGTGESVTLGLIASWSGGNPTPTDFTLNGLSCNGGSTPTPIPTATPTPTPTTTPTPTPTPTPTAGAPELGVTGNRLTDPGGATRRLVGVNRSGGEFMCVQGHGIFDGPVDDAAVQAIADWRANTVRITLNEECWLGLDNIRPEYRGAVYVGAVKELVDRVLAHGMTPVVELHWTYGQYTGASAGCSDVHASCQKPMPDARYAPAFWTSVANTFKDDRRVVFDLFNEPYPDRATATTEQAWACWRDGGTCPGIGYEVAGMQDLVDAVRATGSRNVVLVPGSAYSNDLSGWLAHAPSDPTGQLAAAWHVYNFNSCASETCWTSTLAPVAARVPLVAGEIGENTCGHAFVDRVMKWSDDRGLSYLGWTWNTWDCSSGPALISGYDGTPTAFGIGVRDHLRTLNGH
ncbi:cellulase family glycosylhydrolase [Streptomyces sp. CB01881]|uniref:cellulase family glycosylhydrolase n=1 Tax=Streptomyces sp. CB01881 TaxID=2078691 RepID=UPI000CDCD621|nr:cellulase family glycosylhydrolase [Streptomyces sp. CB01881]AUY53494.1 cellulose-binding protein [Streptomyces sp. CB01881]TYC69643.1 cellulose-binding protein [Streptomyces sp. CB01881]